MGGVAWGPQEEDAAHCFYHFGVRSVRLPPDTLVSGLASGQSSTEPICWQPEQALAAITQASPVRRHAGACGFVEVDRHYEPPAAEAGAFKAVQRDTQWKSARSGTERDAPPLCPTLSGRAALPPSHIPSETVLVGRTPEPARGPLFIFRKIHLYGKTKRSTHGHTNDIPTRTEKSFASSKIFDFAPPTRPPARARHKQRACTHTGTAARPRRPKKCAARNRAQRATQHPTPPHHAAPQGTAPLSSSAATAQKGKAQRPTAPHARTGECTRVRRPARGSDLPYTSLPIQNPAYPTPPRTNPRSASRPPTTALEFWVLVRLGDISMGKAAYPTVLPYKKQLTLYSPHTKGGLPWTSPI
jgi:hypothetical protein